MNRDFSIVQLIEKYKKDFSETWTEDEDWSSKEKESYLKCKKTIDSYSELFFVTFSYSILSGEFINKKDIINSTITQLLNITTKEYGSPTENSVLKEKIMDDFDILNKNIKYACLEYRSIITFYPSHYKTLHNNYRFRVYSQVKNPKSDNKISYFYNLVIDICKFDFYFKYENNSFNELIILKNLIEKFLKKETSKDIIDVLNICKEKIDFLIKKLLLYSGISVFSIDFTDYQLESKDIVLKNFDYLWEQYELFSCIDNKITSVSNHPLIVKYQIKSNENTIKFSELILLMRVYCNDKNSSESQIRNVLDIFNSKYETEFSGTLHEFDNYALNSMKNVMYNCRLSYYLKQPHYTIEKLGQDMEIIADFQYKTGVINYFHFQLAIEYLLKKAKEQISFNDLKVIKELLDKYIVGYNKAINQCQKEKFYPLQLTFEECSFYIKNLDKTVFIPSSFSQPVDYELLKEKADDYRINCLQIENKLDLLKEHETVNELKIKLETTTSKYIEIGGIFVTVLSLLFSVVSFTGTKMNIKDVALNSLGIGYILLIFVSCIYVLTLKRDCKISEILKTFRFYFFIILFILSTISLCLIIK